MNLLERLKPNILQAMEAEANLYPSLIAHLKIRLEEEVISPLYLTVSDASSICRYNNTNLDIVNLLDCFSN